MSVNLLKFNNETNSEVKNKDIDFFFENDDTQTNFDFGENYIGYDSP